MNFLMLLLALSTGKLDGKIGVLKIDNHPCRPENIKVSLKSLRCTLLLTSTFRSGRAAPLFAIFYRILPFVTPPFRSCHASVTGQTLGFYIY